MKELSNPDSELTNIESFVSRLFERVRRRFNLGMREYLAALDAVEGGFGVENHDDLKQTLQLLWCSSLAQQAQLEMMWDELVQAATPIPTKELPQRSASKPPKASLPQPPPPQEKQTPDVQPQPTIQPELEPLALQPPLTPTGIDDLPELQTYWPISRRAMAYAWRYLRRPKLDGPPDVLDIPLTVDLAAQMGFFLAPVYRRREINHAKLLLFIDQGGSMVPFHRFSRDLVDTATSTTDLASVNVFYFYNVPTSYVYEDIHLNQPVELQVPLALCDTDTSVLIFSDAGAARGSQRIERVRGITEFIVQLQQCTPLLGWLNPMPIDRWASTSAEMISYLIPMEQVDKDGFSNLIETVRGQSVSSV